jgi:hypothetical protein
MLFAVATQWSCIITRSTKEKKREPRRTNTRNAVVASAAAVAVPVVAY